MEKGNIIFNEDGIPDTNYFVYRTKNYPIKFDFFKHSSQYFHENKQKLKNTKYIQLVDEETEQNTDFNEEDIKDFINYVQCQQISLESHNVVCLNYLANIYKVTRLQNITNEYISKHEEKVILDIIYQHQNEQSFDTTSYEKIICDNIEKYIEDEQMLKLNINVISRIFQKLKKEPKNDKILDFLIKYLDKYGRQASVLFSEIVFSESDIKYFQMLIEKYSNVFDFNFIDSSAIFMLFEKIKNDEEKNKIEIENMLLKEEENKSKIQNLQNELDTVQQQLILVQKEKETMRQEKDDEISRIRKELNETEQGLKTKLKEKEEEKAKKITEQNEEINQLKNELSQLKKGEIMLFPPLKDDQFNGIIKYMIDQANKVIFTASSIWGNYSNSNPINVSRFDDHSFFISDDKPNGWICIDFNAHKIIPTDYTLKTSRYIRSWYLRSWILEGSVDNESWENLDEEKDCAYLNGRNRIHTFKINHQTSTKFQFIRIRSTGPNWGGSDHLVIESLEIYGILI